MKLGNGDRVFLGDRKTALRVVGFCTLHGERAVELASAPDTERKPTKTSPLRLRAGKAVRARVPVADLVRDVRAQGWRERWRQQDLFVAERPA